MQVILKRHFSSLDQEHKVRRFAEFSRRNRSVVYGGSEKIIYQREIFTPAVCMNEKIVCLYHTACDALVQYINLAEFQRGVGK